VADPGRLVGRVVLADRVVPAAIAVEDGRITAIEPDPAGAGGPYLAPGFIDLHVHGFGGHDAMAGPAALDGMARALLARGVTGFLPAAIAAPIPDLARFGAEARDHMASPPARGAVVLGLNLEGPFLAPGRRGAQPEEHLRRPADVPTEWIEGLGDGLRVVTVAPELAGAVDLIRWLSARGVIVALGHSDASLAEAEAGYSAGARSTTHLFNGMSGLDHRRPGLAAAALADDAVTVELIADGHHVQRALWSTVFRAKPPTGVTLVSDAIAAAGTDLEHAVLGGQEVDLRGGRATLAGTQTLAGSLIGLDDAVRNLVDAGISLPTAVAAASRNPAILLGLDDRGEIAVGRRADLVELNDRLEVAGVLIDGVRG
jgi:N-acetylglucosamine-6-phosphate deacetylase